MSFLRGGDLEVEVDPTAKRRLKERGATRRIVHIRIVRESFQLKRRALVIHK
jgi:hypothetical protein